MEMNNVGCSINKAQKETAADETITRLSGLAGVAENLAERVGIQLRPICQEACPVEEPDSKARELPPMFTDMRASMDRIGGALRLINEVLDRCEV